MTAAPGVAVVVPVHRVERHVQACMESLAAQTVRPVEVVLVDDAGGDRSVELAAAVLDRHGVAHRVLRHPENRGPGAARNTGLAAVSADLVWFLDADDRADPRFLQTLRAALVAAGADVAACRTRRVVDAPAGRGIGVVDGAVDEPPYRDRGWTGRAFARALLRGEVKAYPCNKLFRRAALPPAPWDTGRAYEDVAPVLRLALRTDRIAMVAEPLYDYTWRPGSLAATFSPHTLDLFAVADDVAAVLAGHGLDRRWRIDRIGHLYREVLTPIAHLAMRAGDDPGAAAAIEAVRRRIDWRDLPALAAGRRLRPLVFAVLLRLSPRTYAAVLRRR